MPTKNLRRITEEGTYCHVYNKGVEGKTLFADEADYQVFLDYLEDYLSAPKAHESTRKEFTVNGRVFRGVPHQPKNYNKRVELIAYSLKPDHFHLLLHQKTKKSLQAFIRSLSTRYSMYFNKKYNRTGALFEGPYKSAHVKDEKSLLLLTWYLHKAGGYSTYSEYSGARVTPWVKSKVVLLIKNGQGNYKDYVEKYEPGQQESELLEQISIDNASTHLERRDLEEVSLKPWSRIPELAATGAVFVLLLGLGLRNITTTTKSSVVTPVTLGTNTSASPGPIDSPQPKTMLTVKNIEATSSVNIRKEPTTESKKIGQAHDGDAFEFVSKTQNWYEVKLPDGSTGFILSTFIETGETNNQLND